MKIAFLVGEFPALSETFILNQITGLLDLGQEVDIYAERPRPESATHPAVARYQLPEHTFYEKLPETWSTRVRQAWPRWRAQNFAAKPVVARSLNVFQHGAWAGSLRLYYSALPFLRRGRDYDAVLCHFAANGLRGVRLREIGALRGKLVTFFHGADVYDYPPGCGPHYYRPLWQNGDVFLSISEHCRDLLAQGGCPPEKIRVHRMGVDCRQFAYLERMRPSDAPVKILTVGRLVPKKGIADGLAAVAQVAATHPALEYHIIGDGPLRSQLERAISDLGLQSFVKLHGAGTEEQILAQLAAADIFLAPSHTDATGDSEGIPVVLMEAMATGLPVVSTRHAGIPELVEDGVTGLLAAERDVAELAGCVVKLLNNKRLADNLGRAARSTVERDYNAAKLHRQLLELL